MKEGREGVEKSVGRGKCSTENTAGKRKLGGENWRIIGVMMRESIREGLECEGMSILGSKGGLGLGRRVHYPGSIMGLCSLVHKRFGFVLHSFKLNMKFFLRFPELIIIGNQHNLKTYNSYK